MNENELFYGYDKTIHRTGHVDVELGPDGKVVSVWYRCAMLKFTENHVSADRAKEMQEAYKREIPDIRAMHLQQIPPKEAVGIFDGLKEK